MFTGSIVGRVGQDPDLRATPSGMAVTKFSIASTTRRGETETTTWQRCVAWGGAAETIAKYVRKGHQFAVQGRLIENRWKDKDDREQRILELHVDQFQLLANGPRPENQNQEGTSQNPEVDTSDMP